jgi:hypothetical protein
MKISTATGELYELDSMSLPDLVKLRRHLMAQVAMYGSHVHIREWLRDNVRSVEKYLDSGRRLVVNERS